MITLKDIARECEVSFSTVSKALRGSSEISKETIKLVREKANEIGYHPNLAAQTLRTNRTQDIGVIFEDITGSGFRHQYFATIFGSLQTAAMESGYDLTFMSCTPDYTFDYFEHCRYRNFDGVAILYTDFMRKDVQSLVASDIPTVTLDYALDDNHYAVMNDNRRGMSELLEYIISLGHSRIAFIHGGGTDVTQERVAAFNEVMMRHSLKVESRYLVDAVYHDPVSSDEAAFTLMKMKNPPTCILFPDDFSALGGIHRLNKMGLEVGSDVSVAGYDGIMLTSLITPPLTTYRQAGDRIGRLMMESLVEQIEAARNKGKKSESSGDDGIKSAGAPRHKIVTGELVRGASVAMLTA